MGRNPAFVQSNTTCMDQNLLNEIWEPSTLKSIKRNLNLELENRKSYQNCRKQVMKIGPNLNFNFLTIYDIN